MCKLVMQMRWDQTKRFLGDIRTLYNEGQALVEKQGDPVMLDRKKLERTQGFLVYVARTYTTMLPYLKGVHLLTIDSWRAHRDDEGWRIKEDEGSHWRKSQRPRPHRSRWSQGSQET